jgi:hypothetical protein
MSSSSSHAHDLAAIFTSRIGAPTYFEGPSLNLHGELSVHTFSGGSLTLEQERETAGRIIQGHHQQVLGFVGAAFNKPQFTRSSPLILTFELGEEDIPPALQPRVGAALSNFSRFRGVDMESGEELYESVPYEVYVFKYESGIKYSAYPVSLQSTAIRADSIYRDPPVRSDSSQGIVLRIQQMMNQGVRVKNVSALVIPGTRDPLREPGIGSPRVPDVRRMLSRERGPLVGETEPVWTDTKYDVPEEMRQASASAAQDAVKLVHEFLDAERRTGTPKSVTEVSIRIRR